MKNYKVIAFDLDGTLAESKSKISTSMSILLDMLMEKYIVAVISGGARPQFELQLLPYLTIAPHIMPTCGTSYYRHDAINGWQEVYKLDLHEDDKKKIFDAFQKALDETNFEYGEIFGEQIEDRGSQITFSALGQKAHTNLKNKWDPTKEKRLKIISELEKYIPEFEIRYGGSTSIDVTHKGIDKAFGMNKLMEHLFLNKEDILFIGDALGPEGNDYPVKEMGIDCIEVIDPKHTEQEIIKLLKDSIDG